MYYYKSLTVHSARDSILLEKIILRGRVRFPTGGIVRELLDLQAADLVRFQDRQYSLDERRSAEYELRFSKPYE